LTQLWSTLIAVAVGLGIVWVALLIALAAARPKTISVTPALRLLPDTVVLLRRLAADPQLTRGVRVRLLLALLYLILPIDLVPDFIPSSATPTTPSSSPPPYAQSPAEPDRTPSTSTGPAPPKDSTPSDALPASRLHPRPETPVHPRGRHRITTERCTSPCQS
jgi:hypothetical protein